MLEDDDMEDVYDESGGLAASDRRLILNHTTASPFLLARKLSSSSAGCFGAKFSDNGGPDYGTSIERLESSNCSTAELSRTTSTNSFAEEASEDVYTLLGKFISNYRNTNILAPDFGDLLFL